MVGVAIQAVRKTFRLPSGREVIAVHDLSLEVEDQQFVVLVGPSGSGKTTLLRLIAGLDEPSAGSIAIAGKPMSGVPPHERGVSIVFQEHSLYPHLTVHDNLALGLRLRKTARGAIESRVAEVAQWLGIERLLERSPAELSGGERQRAALGRALVVGSKVILMDEPLSNLDGPLRVQMRREIRKLHDRLGVTLIYVTHDQGEAMALGDRIAVIQDGKIAQIGSPMELYHAPANLFVADFVGMPGMNLIAGQFERAGGRARFCPGGNGHPGGPAVTWPISPDAKWPAQMADVVLGLRGEAIHLADAGSESTLDGSGLLGQVTFVERLGWETQVGVFAAGVDWVLRVTGPCLVEVGQTVGLRYEMKEARWFDPATGAALSL